MLSTACGCYIAILPKNFATAQFYRSTQPERPQRTLRRGVTFAIRCREVELALLGRAVVTGIEYFHYVADRVS